MMLKNIVDYRIREWRFIALAALILIGRSISFADVIPANRMTAWAGNVGVEGGIPNSSNMTVYATLTPSSGLSAINAAIAACPSNQVVQLAAGTYNLSGQILFSGVSGVVLRGAGTSNTILNISAGGAFGTILVQGPNYYSAIDNGVPSSNIIDCTGGYNQGSSNLVLASVSGLSVGIPICLDQINDGTDVNSSGYEGCDYCGRASGTRSQMQWTKIRAISGNTVTIWPPVYMPNWTNSESPQVWWFGRFSEKCGIENLTANAAGSSPSPYGSVIGFANTWNCWVKNCLLEQGYEGFLDVYMGGRCEMRHCYLCASQGSASLSYGVISTYSTACWYEDNIFNQVCAPFLLSCGAAGNVFSYNYITNVLYTAGGGTWLDEGLTGHEAYNCMNLFEGNWYTQSYFDYIHGSGGYNTVFRNRALGWEPGKTANTYCMSVDINQYYHNAAGNVFGTVGYHNEYQSAAGGSEYGGAAIYNIGVHLNYAGFSDDPKSLSTFYRHGNYDTVNNSIVWNATNSDHTIPNSLIYSSQPSWYGGVWPPIDPANGASIAATVNSRTNIPAGYRFVYGVDPSSTPVNISPSITTQPSSLSVSVGQSATFIVGASGTSPLTYQWKFNSTAISGATASSYALNNAQTSNSGSYSVMVTNNYGSVASVAATLTVTNSAPMISSQPQSLSLPPGTNATFSVVASGTPPLAYQWRYGTANIAGATTSSYTITGITTNNAGGYSVVVTNNYGSATSATVTLTIATGLVAAYGFEEGGGSAVSDSSGNGNAGTISGAAWSSSGRYGNALSFNGTNSMITVNDSASLDLTAGMTLEAWVYPTALGSSWSEIIFKATDIYFLMGSTPQGQLADVGGSFASTNAYGVTSLPLNTWSHLAGTYDGSNLRLYVNGVQVSSRAQTGAIATSTGALSIGGDSTSGQYWTGMIDEVRIYNRALSSTDIVTDMNTPVIGSTGARPVPPPPPQNLRVLSQ